MHRLLPPALGPALAAFALSACMPVKPEAPAPGRLPTEQATVAPAEGSLQQVLEDHHWTLESAADGAGGRIDALSLPQARPVAFDFSASRLSIQGPCNRLFGGYRIDAEGRVAVQALATGRMACEPPAMQGDAALAGLLKQTLRAELTPEPTLRLSSDAGGVLVLRGELTPEALYGEPTRVFLEVAPQRIACKHPSMPDATCLQVRERRYDAQGLRVELPGAAGEPRPMFEPIEGYTHTPGVRHVLRLKRFTRSPAPADASAYVYVLDLVVESESVPR